MTIASSAATEWSTFHDHVESQCGARSELAGIQDFAAKAAEHAARAAGILTIIRDLKATTIDISEMSSAVTLVDWYVNEALRLHSASRTDPALRRAQTLLDWIETRADPSFEFRDILRLGPAAVRTRVAAEAACAILKEHRWVEELPDKPRRFHRRHRGLDR